MLVNSEGLAGVAKVSISPPESGTAGDFLSVTSSTYLLLLIGAWERQALLLNPQKPLQVFQHTELDAGSWLQKAGSKIERWVFPKTGTAGSHLQVGRREGGLLTVSLTRPLRLGLGILHPHPAHHAATLTVPGSTHET